MHSEDSFAWGVATSAYQSEGAWNTDGKGISVWDKFSRKKNRIQLNHNAEMGNDFYNRYPEDLDILSQLNISHFRWSVSWPRVIPGGYGAVNHKGLDFYDRLTDECLRRNITPWVTLYHWDLPQALEDKGGWTNRNIVDWYSEYAIRVIKKLGDRVKHWMSLNEPLAFTGAGYFLGVHAPGRKGMNSFLPALHHSCLAQAEGIRVARQYCYNAIAGTTFSCSAVTPFSNSVNDKKAAKKADALFNRLFIEPLIGMGYPFEELPFLNRIEQFFKSGDEKRLVTIPDFVGLQNYTREVIAYNPFIPYIQARRISAERRKVPITQLKWEIHPESLGEMIRQFSGYKNIPSLVITENGAAFNDYVSNGSVNDPDRIRYLKSYIAEVQKARDSGCPLKGYFVWSLTDNFEWTEGYLPRFGLVHVDYDNMKRTIKDSGFWYSEHIRNQQESTKTVVPALLSGEEC